MKTEAMKKSDFPSVKLSIIILTLDEERNIERCLRSVQDIADEIVVVDSFSTDGTFKICQRFNVRFLTHRFEGFIEQKTWAVKQASYDHILSIEGDEVLSEELKRSVMEVKERWSHDAYTFNRLSCYCGKWIRHSGWYPDTKMRLWDRRIGKFGGENPHDQFILDKTATRKHLKGDLLHQAFSTIGEHMATANRYSDVKADGAFRKGKRAHLLDLLFRPPFKFLRSYFLKFGILDGFYGFVISIISAQATFLKYAKLKDLRQRKE